MLQTKICNNIDDVRSRIEAAAFRTGRKAEEITLIAVSKMHDVPEIREAVDCGIVNLGENKVQELCSKYDKIQNVNWHLIGHLQTNKVKNVVGKVSLIHSVDSMRLAEEIDLRSKQIGIISDILLQVNAAGEESKFGLSCEEVLPLYDNIKANCSNVNIRGLMQIAPAIDDQDELRVYFRKVKKLFDSLQQTDILSMGMSSDFETAIEEGANMVRIGTLIFGERNYGNGCV